MNLKEMKITGREICWYGVGLAVGLRLASLVPRVDTQSMPALHSHGALGLAALVRKSANEAAMADTFNGPMAAAAILAEIGRQFDEAQTKAAPGTPADAPKSIIASGATDAEIRAAAAQQAARAKADAGLRKGSVIAFPGSNLGGK